MENNESKCYRKINGEKVEKPRSDASKTKVFWSCYGYARRDTIENSFVIIKNQHIELKVDMR